MTFWLIHGVPVSSVFSWSEQKFCRNSAPLSEKRLIAYCYWFSGTQLSCCATLGLFATSSEDHCVKIWNSDNQLVREMCFDESLCGVCFANSRGDILVGFQSHISLVTILNYLPLSYLEILSKMHFDNDPFEDHVQFNDLLKFWYDPDRVPRMPLEAIKRRPLEPTEVKRPGKRRKVVWLNSQEVLFVSKIKCKQNHDSAEDKELLTLLIVPLRCFYDSRSGASRFTDQNCVPSSCKR